MSNRTRIATVTGAALASLFLVSGAAAAGEYAYSGQRHKAVYDYAKVVSVRPIVRYVTVTTPVKECWDDVEYHTTAHRQPGKAGRALFGAIVGGVIGHQFGSGSGNDAATIAGSLIGAAVASDGADGGPRYVTTEHARPVRRCETNYRSEQQERIDGYDVLYKYHGRTYATRTPFDPGNRIRIRVDIRPVG